MSSAHPVDGTFEAVERAQLMDWVRLSAAAKLDFFEEMIGLAYCSGALTPERLALRDQVPGTPGDADNCSD